MAQNNMDSSEQVATQVATNTGTGSGSAGNNTTGNGVALVASPTPVVAPKGFRSELQLMLQGWQELIPSDSTVQSSAGSLTEAGVLTQLQEYLGAYTDLDTHVTAAQQSRGQVKSQLAAARKYHSVLKSAVTNLYGADSPQLAKFGLKAKKPRAPLNSQQLAVRAEKASATRALRGTTGPVAKQETKSGPMKFVAPVPKAEQFPPPQGSAGGSGVASTAASGSSVSAASPPGEGTAGQPAGK